MDEAERPRDVFSADVAPEIELAFVAGLWHEPARIPAVLRWLAPEVHLRQPHLRLVVAALSRCYSELGAPLDFAIVVECLRDLGQLEECGGREGLDNVFSASWHPSLFHIYAEFLKAAALRRARDPQAPPPYFSGGYGRIDRNKVRRSPVSPVWTGSARIRGQAYTIRAYLIPGSEGLDLKFDPL